MSIISRLTTWTIGQVLKAADLNAEFSNITNVLNNLDAATTTWTNVKATTLTSVTTTVLKGTATNDSAATGNIGEYVSSSNTNQTATTSTNWGDLVNISLTAGDWDISGILQFEGVANVTRTKMGISSTTGNSTTGLVLGDNFVEFLPVTAAASSYGCIPSWRVSIASTTIYYLKYTATYSGTAPAIDGRISARRVR